MHRGRVGLLAILLCGCAVSGAWAQDKTVPFYVGAAIGQGAFDTQFFSYSGGTDTVRGEPLGWKVLFGTRPLPLLGAEVEYIDFGQARSGANGQITETHTQARAAAAFVVGYLPLPSPNLDVFFKIGAARLRSDYAYSGDFPNVCIFNPALNSCITVGRTSVSGDSFATGFIYGVGAQLHFGALALRGELERISTSESVTAPDLLSIGLTWAF